LVSTVAVNGMRGAPFQPGTGPLTCHFFRAACRIRTDDLLFTSALLEVAGVADLVVLAGVGLKRWICGPDSQGVREPS
jgi:hypothetical protein